MKERMYCPICDQEHEIDFIEREEEVTVKNQSVRCVQMFYRCGNAADDNEFVTGKMLNANLLAAKDAYRKQCGLLTSTEIRTIREMYHLTQVELSTLLDWGEVTITRYETKQIQDEAHNDMMVLISQDPKTAYDRLVEHEDAFSKDRYRELKELFCDLVVTFGVSSTKRKVLEEVYTKYDAPSELNGNKVLDIDKTIDVISYFAIFVSGLSKVKLMKMMWYADMLSYQRTGQSLTGLVYLHEKLGAMPHGHREVLALNEICVKEEDLPNYSNPMIKILPKKELSNMHFTELEKIVLDTIIAKFKNFTATEISEYMHQETAYTETKTNQPISFKYADQIRI